MARPGSEPWTRRICKLFQLLLVLLPTLVLRFANADSMFPELSTTANFVDGKYEPSKIWHYKKHAVQLRHAFKSVSVRTINLKFPNGEDSKYNVLSNSNVEHLKNELNAGKRFFGFVRRWRIFKSMSLNPFVDSYVAVESDRSYTVALKVRDVDPRLVVSFLVGVCLFLFASNISRTVMSYYVTGACFSILGSFVVLLFLLGRLLPRRSVSIALYWGGFSFWIFFIVTLWQNALNFIILYKKWFIVYSALASLLSFAIMYRWGTPVHPRTQKLFQWTIQLVGLTIIAISCQLPFLSVAIVASLVVTNLLPDSLIDYGIKLWFQWNRPKPRLLTEAEYQAQGVIETEKALEQLRSFCQSPECNKWDMLKRLKDPEKFISFVSGGDHLSNLTDSDNDKSEPNLNGVLPKNHNTRYYSF